MILLYRTGLSRVQTSLKARLEAEVEAGIEPLVLVVSVGNKDKKKSAKSSFIG